MSEQRTPDAEREALEALLESAGWQIYEAAMLEQWSPVSYEREIRKAMKEAALGEDVTGIVGQINATYEGMRQMIKWPRERARLLAMPKRNALEDAFTIFKRVRS